MLIFLVPPLIGAVIWYGLYRLVKKSEEERWSRGIGKMPDIRALRMKFLISYLIVQVLFGWFLSALSHFPAQR